MLLDIVADGGFRCDVLYAGLAAKVFEGESPFRPRLLAQRGLFFALNFVPFHSCSAAAATFLAP